MHRHPTRTALILLLTLVILGACSVTKKLPEKEQLLIGNKFKVNNKAISTDELSGYLQQEPNSKLFGLFRTNIAIYNMASKGKDTKFKKWLRTKVGSAPVILDTTVIPVSVKNMSQYLNNTGYFNSRVKDSVVLKKKKATVFYLIEASKPYRIRNINYVIHDTALASWIYKDTTSSLVRKGAIFNTYTLDGERTRITNYLLNQGFYHFSSSFIFFRVDSALNQRRMDIRIEITNPVAPSLAEFGAVVETSHKRYSINNVYIYPEFDHLMADSGYYDTLVATFTSRHDLKSTYYFLYKDKFPIKPRTIAQNVLIESGSVYSARDVDKTYSHLSGLQVFKYVNVGFEDVRIGTVTKTDNPNLLDCRIRLAPAPAHSISVSGDGTNSAGSFGTEGALGYRNRNIFKGGQLFSVSLNGSAQSQPGSNTGLFSTLEFGVNTSITFPQFLLPIKPEKLAKSFQPKTVFTLGYNFQQQHDPDFTRNLVNASFGYTWRQNEKLDHVLNPIELLLVKMNPSQAFTEELDSIGDNRLKNQYTSHIVAGLKYTLRFSNQDIKKRKNFLFIQSNFETGGNLLYGITSLIDTPKDEFDNYTIFGISYAEYVRPDIDIRYYFMMGRNNRMVTRFVGGIGIPYGNSSVLPYEKAFIAGGANDMRGWRMGQLGPGTFYNDTVSQNFGQVGDMQLQLNLEYRIAVAGFFKAALFTDIGNVWLLKPSETLPGGEFQFNTFLKQLGIDVGLGLRFDFDFFILRLDPAIRIRVPSYPDHGSWYFTQLQLKDIIWNFGIGYPF